MTDKTLQLADFCEVANEHGYPVAAIKAVAKTESGGRGGFNDNGALIIRFEGHIFRKYTNRQFDKSHPHLSYTYENRHGKPHGYSAFNEAFALDKHAAMLATSFGMFQQMGFNHDEMGYDSVDEMVADFQTGEKAQLKAFARLIKKWGLNDEMRNLDSLNNCRIVAKGYNGEDYADNDYHNKIHQFYRYYKKQNLDCSQSTDKDIEDALEKVLPSTLPNQIEDLQNQEAVNETAIVSASADTTAETELKGSIESASDTSTPSLLDSAQEKLNSATQVFDKVQTASNTITERKDGLKAMLAMIGNVVFQPIFAFAAFLYNMPTERWIVVAIIVAIAFLAWHHRQFILGKIREEK